MTRLSIRIWSISSKNNWKVKKCPSLNHFTPIQVSRGLNWKQLSRSMSLVCPLYGPHVEAYMEDWAMFYPEIKLLFGFKCLWAAYITMSEALPPTLYSVNFIYPHNVSVSSNVLISWALEVVEGKVCYLLKGEKLAVYLCYSSYAMLRHDSGKEVHFWTNIVLKFLL